MSAKVLSWLKGGLAVCGVMLVLTDWTQVLGRWPMRIDPLTGQEIYSAEEHQRWMTENIHPNIGSLFYNWSANYSWLTSLIMRFDTVEHENRAHVGQRYWELTKKGLPRKWVNGNPGPQYFPAIPVYEAFKMANGVLVAENAVNHGHYEIIGGSGWGGKLYEFPPGTVFSDVRSNIFVTTYWDTAGRSSVIIKCDKYGEYKGLGTKIGNWEVNYVMSIYVPYDETKKPFLGLRAHSRTGEQPIKCGEPDNFEITWESLMIPATDYINNAETIQERLAEIEDEEERIVFEFPHIENPTGDIHIDFWDWINAMKDWDPVAGITPASGTNPGTNPDPNPDPNPNPNPDPGTDPEPDEDQDKDNGHYHLFPFCIPFDVVNMIKGLFGVPEAPRWEIPFALPGPLAFMMEREAEIIVVDLSFLEQIMPFVRLMILAGFVMMLAKATSSFIKW